VTDQPDVEQCGPDSHPADAEHQTMNARLARLETVTGVDRHGTGLHLPAWLRPTRGEHRAPVALALLLLVALQIVIRDDLAVQPRYLLPALELVLFVALSAASPKRINRESVVLRSGGVVLLVAAAVGTAWSVSRLVYLLATGQSHMTAMGLLVSGGTIWLMNIITFAIGYWEFDRGGPAARAHARVTQPDFLFPQMATPELASRDWEPAFLDYLYVSFTNATAFSPTDTLPLSRWAKLTMMSQSAISLVTVALVVARAVNIFT
jgi:uncharacterized membrane protein